MLLRGETNFFVRSLSHHSVIILIFLISNMVTKLNLRITSQVFSKNLKNQRTLRYPKNSLQLSYDSTETSDVKTRRKSNQCWIYSNTCFISTFFRLVQILCNLVPGGSSLWHYCEKVKRSWRRALNLSLRSRPPLVEGLVSNANY